MKAGQSKSALDGVQLKQRASLLDTGGTVAERYRLEDELGRGGMATVYRAQDLRLGRAVAVKLLHPFLATKPESAERFLRESQAIARLHHQNIIEIHDASQDPATQLQYIVMELIEGPTLEAFIKAHPTRVPEFGLCMIACLCDALDHAHTMGVIHRDIKPENIMFTADGTIKLMDFGIARLLDAERLTVSGCMLGSPAHMAPEIINGEKYSFTCDIFALGTVLYDVLTNTLPFVGATPAAVFNAILSNDYIKPSHQNDHVVSRACDQIVARCFEIKPEARYETVMRLREAILEQLKIAGMEDYVVHLRNYYKDPKAYERKMLPVIIEHFIERATSLFAEKKLAAAIEILNRILVYEPANARALELLASIRTSKSIHRAVIGFLCAFFLALLVGSALWFWHDISSIVDAIESDPQQNNAKQDQSQSIAETSDTKKSFAENSNNIGLDNSKLNELAQNSALSNVPDQASAGSDRLPDALTPTANDPAQPKSDRLDEPKPFDDVKKQEDSSVQDEKDEQNSQNLANSNIKDIEKQDLPQNTRPHTGPKQKFIPPEHPNPSQKENGNDPKITLPSTEKTIHITQPIFPYDGYALISGKSNAGVSLKKSFLPDNKGYIHIELPPGSYTMDLTCEKKCVPQTKIALDLNAANDGKTLPNIILKFADARLTVKSDSRMSFYYLAFDRRSKSPTRLMPNDAVRFGNFDSYVDRLDVTIYKIPVNTELPDYKPSTLSKFDNQRVTLTAGELTTVNF